MPSLSGAPGCDSCLLLRQKVVELEVRLANLYQIKLDEQFIDSIVSVWVTPRAVVRSRVHPVLCVCVCVYLCG